MNALAPVLSQARTTPASAEDWLIIVVVAVFVTVVVVLVWRDQRRSSAAKAGAQAAIAEQRRLGQVQQERDDRAYAQHVHLNDLTGEKLQAENKVLIAQLAAMERDRIARERDDEFHQLMVHKSKLEIQSLQLHIREQRKRIDDFNSYDEE